MTQTFFSKLTSAIESNHTLLCVGLDPRTDKLAADLKPGETLEERLVEWGTTIIEQTSDLVCCYKPNFAFYEQCGPEGAARPAAHHCCGSGIRSGAAGCETRRYWFHRAGLR